MNPGQEVKLGGQGTDLMETTAVNPALLIEQVVTDHTHFQVMDELEMGTPRGFCWPRDSVRRP